MNYVKTNVPLRVGDKYAYLPTTADQVILSDGTRLEQGGKLPWRYYPVEFSVTFTAGGWSEEKPHVQTVTVEGVRVSDKLTADVDLTGANETTYVNVVGAYGCISRLSFGDGVITGYCYMDTPTLDVTVRLWGIREV